MNCTEFGPWVSRYVDEDLDGQELEAFLEHLAGCAECQKELVALDRLRGWFQAADAFQGIPETRGRWGLSHLLLQPEESREPTDYAETLAPMIGREILAQGKARALGTGWIKRYSPPFPALGRPFLRLALPLLVVTCAATWLFTRNTTDWIDVRELQPSPPLAVAFPQEEGHEMDFFVMQHAAHQPWADHGDEFPRIELASSPLR